MTSPKTWSSASTSRRHGPLRACLALALLLGGGCAPHGQRAQAPPPTRGYADLGALVRRHPGWRGVGQYDAALGRLESLERTPPPAGGSGAGGATLPGLPAPRAGASPPAGDAAREAARLTGVEQELLQSLRGRRKAARVDQVRQQRDVWRREARLRFPLVAVQAAIAPDLELQLLEANVKTLTRTLDNWRLSPPPAPKRDALRAKVEAERARLDALIAARQAAGEADGARRLTAVAALRATRRAYVQAQADALEGRLGADDSRLIAARSGQLAGQRRALLLALSRPTPLGVPDAGGAGARTLPGPHGQARAALSQTSLRAALVRLRAERARWVRFLYDDTQAAALDTASQQHWDLTLGPPRAGDRDLTAALTRAMAASVWHL